jgi:two-component system response regulator AtoC
VSDVREHKPATDAAAGGVPDATADAVHDAEAAAEAAPAPRHGASPRTFRPIDDEIRELERRRMIEALAATGGVQNRAADLIHMPLRTFVTKLKRYAITPSDWSDAL